MRLVTVLLVFLVSITTTRVSFAAEHGVIVQYHHVDTGTPPSTTISPADFRSHLEYLQDNDFNVVPLDTMLSALRNKEQLPDRSLAITFDDGYLSIYEQAYPLLREFGFPFTLFVSTQPIDNSQPGFMNWDQISEMAENGALIANHLVDHPYMIARTEGESESQWIARIRGQLLSAEQRIATNTGQSHRLLAYPYGEYNQAIKDLLAEEGFIGIAQNSGAVGFNSDFLAIPRFPLAGIYASLETARVKFDSLAFRIEEQVPRNPVTNEQRPAVQLRFAPGDYSRDQINCFANGEPLETNWLDAEQLVLELRPAESFTGRRWRYICTAQLPGSSRFYWYSVQWINPERPE